jgi:hypothetical protein
MRFTPSTRNRVLETSVRTTLYSMRQARAPGTSTLSRIIVEALSV